MGAAKVSEALDALGCFKEMLVDVFGEGDLENLRDTGVKVNADFGTTIFAIFEDVVQIAGEDLEFADNPYYFANVFADTAHDDGIFIDSFGLEENKVTKF